MTEPNLEVLAQFQTLFVLDDGCILPCFAGLEPGNASVEEIERVIDHLDYEKSIANQLILFGNYNFSVPFSNGGMLFVGFTPTDNRLQRTVLGLVEPKFWLPDGNVFELRNLIEQLGVPEDIFVAFGGPPLRFTFVLVYNEQGVLVRYAGEYTSQIRDDQPLPICFSPDQVRLYKIDAWLKSPDPDHLVEDNQPGLREDNQEVRPFWSLERVTGQTEVQFADFLLNNPDECIEALSIDQLLDLDYVF